MQQVVTGSWWVCGRSQHLASSEEFARGTNAHVDFERPVAAAPGIGAGGSPSLSTVSHQPLPSYTC